MSDVAFPEGLPLHPDLFREYQNSREGGRFAHAWILQDRGGAAAFQTAMVFAAFALGGGDPANGVFDATSAAGRLLSAGAHPDFILLEPLKGVIPVSAVRDAIELFHVSASQGGRRVVLVRDADRLNRNAANALLKTLEEPPDGGLIILTTSVPGALLTTIRSRCRRLRVDAETAPAAVSASIDRDLAMTSLALELERSFDDPVAAILGAQSNLEQAAKASVGRSVLGRAEAFSTGWQELEDLRHLCLMSQQDNKSAMRRIARIVADTEINASNASL
jgi:DNA polymerase III subunit delta'